MHRHREMIYEMAKLKLLLLTIILISPLYTYCIEDTDTLYKVVCIKSKKSYYIIHAKRNDSVFKIISRKISNTDTNLERIKIGHYYYFDFGYTEDQNDTVIFIDNYMDMRGVYYDDNKLIRYRKRFHYKLYETKSLKGLYYIPPPVRL